MKKMYMSGVKKDKDHNKNKNNEKKRDEKGVVMNEHYSWSSSTSSIGKNSDLSMEKSEDDTEEVQSCLNSVKALEEALPIRRGISRFYNGRSKAFTNLRDTSPSSSSSSIKQIAKPENAYIRKRRNLLASALYLKK